MSDKCNIFRVLVACPKGVVTGGPEALHQLAHSINSQSREVFLWDPNNSDKKLEPDPEYSGYELEWFDGQPQLSDVLVIPEIWEHLIPKYYGTNLIVFWWLSVDNFQARNQIPLHVFKQEFPRVIHAYQSEYARNYLESNEINNVIPLSDYINSEFVQSVQDIERNENLPRKNLIAVNPRKGFERTSKVLECLGGSNVMRLENLSRLRVAEALAESDFYLDLGGHPGQDRIPREAALMNCIVVTNQRGSASNEIDIPIKDDIFKFDDYSDDFEKRIVEALGIMQNSMPHYRTLQDDYRESIRNGKEKFFQEVTKLLKVIADT